MKEQIQQLIANGQIKDALNILVRLNSDAVLLQAQYNSGEKQFNLGLLDFSDWQRIQARVIFAALEMAGKAVPSRPEKTNPATGAPTPEIFLVYNEGDIETAQMIKKYFSRHGILSINDFSSLNAGQEISDFVKDKAFKSQFILVLISRNSIKEGWTGLERHLDVLSNSLIQNNVIALALDDSFTKPGFVEQEILDLEKKLDVLEDQLHQKAALKQPLWDLEAQKADLTFRFNNLPKIVQRLRNIWVTDIGGDKFESAMQKVLQMIQKALDRVVSADANLPTTLNDATKNRPARLS